MHLYLAYQFLYDCLFFSFQCRLRYLKACLLHIPSITLILTHVNWLIWLRVECADASEVCMVEILPPFWAFDILSIDSLHVKCKHLLFLLPLTGLFFFSIEFSFLIYLSFFSLSFFINYYWSRFWRVAHQNFAFLDFKSRCIIICFIFT